jgi:type II secretory pathway component GspD/PulD (secretin)
VKANAKKARDAYEAGAQAQSAQDWQAAYDAYTEAVNWSPDERQYILAREIARSRLVQFKVEKAEREAVSGRLDAARRELLAANYLDPTNAVVRERLTQIGLAEIGKGEVVTEREIASELRLEYKPGTQDFDYRGDTQGAYEELARRFGVEAAFDVDLRSRPVRFRASDLDFPTAARLLGDMTRTFWRPESKRMFFVTEDTPQKRREYEVSVVRTMLLPASQTPEQMTEIVRLVRDIAGVTRSESDVRTRTLTLRGSPQAIAVAADLIRELEQPVGELILEIEVLEVDRNRARELGIIPPQTAQAFTLSPQQVQEAQQSFQGLVNVIAEVFGLPSSLSGLTASQIASMLSSGQLTLGSLIPPLIAFGGGKTTFLATLPGAVANFAEMLSLVKQGRRMLLRAQDGQPATFFVGERIPVSMASYSASVTTVGPSVNANVDYPVGKAPSFVASADLRGGGTPDLVVANSVDNNIEVLQNNGSGGFTAQTPVDVGTDPAAIATGDFDGDTHLDLAVANNGSNTISILLGKGDDTFTAGTPVPTGNSPVAVVAADFHDSVAGSPLDLAVANQGDNTISIFAGKGDGTFPPSATSPTLLTLPAGSEPTALVAADFNGDGHLDLAVAEQGTNVVTIFLGNGDGTFKAGVDYPTGKSPVSVAAGDFDGDNILDLAVANHADNTVTVLLGKGDGTFTEATGSPEPVGQGPSSIALADFNVDQKLDVAVADQGDSTVSLLLNTGSGRFAPAVKFAVGTGPVSAVSADFNGDSRPDLATANNGADSVSVILNSLSLANAANSLAGVPYPGVEYLDIGLKVKATPRIHPKDEVTLQMSFDISSLTSQSFNSIPVISNQSITQTLRLKENQTAAAAGFMEPQVSNAINGTPGLAEVPGVGWVVKNENAQNTDTELLILVTPRMVRLAPRKDHAIYAGQGAPEGPAGGGPPAREEPRPGQPAPPLQPPPGTTIEAPQAPGAPPGQTAPPPEGPR